MNQIKEDQKKKKKVNRSVWVHSTLLIARAMLVTPISKQPGDTCKTPSSQTQSFFFFFSRKTFSASCQHSYNSSIKPSPRWNSPPGQPDAPRLQPAGAPLHAIVLHQVKSLQQSSIEEPTDTSSPAIGCTPCKTHSKHFLMDHRPRQDRVYPCFAPYSHDVAQSPAFGTIPSLG